MAIDFYDLNDKNHKDIIFQIEEKDLLIIEVSLIKLQKLTGVNLDAYGKTRMHPDHVKLWLKLLEECLLKEGKQNLKIIKSLYDFLKKTVDNSSGLLIIGD